MNNLKEFKGAPTHDCFKSDVFSIAMTVLEAGCLESIPKNCYSTVKGMINWN
jgi:hypothetical protein